MSGIKESKPRQLQLYDDHAIDEHMASLRYAGMIQQALLPESHSLQALFREYFVLYLPRDIVSGDFYYTFCNRDYLYIAAGDCTGHGVPGALLSILGISFLNEILQSKIHNRPNRILNIMREKVMKVLHQTGERADTKDSIDIGLCVINCKTGQMQFSGANRPLIRVRNGELHEYRPDLMTIGLGPVRESSFTSIDVDITEGDVFYMFSDGYSDQFGEATNKKLKHFNFKKIIERISRLPLEKQRDELEKSFREWKGKEPQVDDVMIFGFRYN
ncbi:MAG: SpoIIE family protein phosphatase [Bacteroidales bacterium]